MLKFIGTIIKVLSDPFGWWLEVKIPPLPNGSGISNLSPIELLQSHRKEILESIHQGIMDKNQLHNETVTQVRSLKLNIFIAAAAFLGIILGFSLTRDFSLTKTQIVSAWILLFCIIFGPISIMVDWSFESARIAQAQHNDQLAWLLLTRGGNDDYAKDLLKKNMDDLLKIPKWMFWFYQINQIVSSLCFLGFFVSAIILSTNILLQNKNLSNKEPSRNGAQMEQQRGSNFERKWTRHYFQK